MGLELFYMAFLDLTSCRSAGYSTEGLIPWTATRQWAASYQLDEEQTEDLEYHIPRMDEVYLRFKTRKMAAANKSPPSRKR